MTFVSDFQNHSGRASGEASGADHALSALRPLDQRAWPRVTGDFPVALRNGLGQHCAATLRNLSPDGMQVHCSLATARVIYPGSGNPLAGDQPLLHATVVLPLYDGPQTLSAGVRLLHLEAVDSHHCILGFRFLDLRPRARRLIDAFYAEQLRLTQD